MQALLRSLNPFRGWLHLQQCQQSLNRSHNLKETI